MFDIKNILKSLNIEETYRHPDVVPTLSTYSTLISSPEYNIGSFLSRLVARYEVVDDFRADAIAYVKYSQCTRKMKIVINPYFLWLMCLKSTIKNAKDAEGVENLLYSAFKNGGWTKNAFSTYIEFCKKHPIKNLGKYGRSYSDSKSQEFGDCLISILIHELLHSIWNHLSFQRNAEKKNVFEHKMENIAEDFSINQTLYFGEHNNSKFMTSDNQQLLNIFKDGGAPMNEQMLQRNAPALNINCFESEFLNQPFEYYLQFIKNNKKEDLEKLLGSTKVKVKIGDQEYEFDDIYDMFDHIGDIELDGETESGGQDGDKESASNSSNRGNGGAKQFDDFNHATSESKKVTKNNLKRVVDDMLDTGEERDIESILKNSPIKLNGYFEKIISGLYKTDTISWEQVLKNYIYKSIGHQSHEYSLKRECRSIPGMFPGKERLGGLDLNLIIDVSGSINFEDFNRFMNEIVIISRSVDVPLIRYMQFHSEVALDEMVPPTKIKNIGIKSTGGTYLASALKKLKADRNTKLTVVFTDGYIEDEGKADDYSYPIILFVSSSGSEYVVDNLRKRFKVIHQDGNNNSFK